MARTTTTRPASAGSLDLAMNMARESFVQMAQRANFAADPRNMNPAPDMRVELDAFQRAGLGGFDEMLKASAKLYNAAPGDRHAKVWFLGLLALKGEAERTIASTAPAGAQGDEPPSVGQLLDSAWYGAARRASLQGRASVPTPRADPIRLAPATIACAAVALAFLAFVLFVLFRAVVLFA